MRCVIGHTICYAVGDIMASILTKSNQVFILHNSQAMHVISLFEGSPLKKIVHTNIF